MTAASTLRLRRYVAWIAADAVVVACSLFLAWSGRSITAHLSVHSAFRFGLLAIGVYCLFNHLFSIYRRLWRYASAGEVVVIAEAVLVSTAVLILTDLLWPGRRAVPLSVALFTGFFAFVGFVAVRYRERVWRGFHWRPWSGRKLSSTRARVLIFGAGEVGQLMAWRLLNQKEGEQYELIGFVDDSPAKLGMMVHGVPVLGNRHAIPELVARHRADVIIIAMYNIGREDYRDILTICQEAPVRVKVLPNLFDFIERTSGLPPIRDVTIEDLLGRKPVQIDRDACRGLLAGKTVLVTGAAGSIGSELCRQVAAFSPRCLLMLDNNESALYELVLELESIPGSPPLRGIIGDVTNGRKMEAVFEQHRPEIVFHAAAYKHVPLMEEYPDEAVRVNVLGTLTVMDLACHCRAERFVLVSTDKAVSPTSVMGATKRLGEMLVSSLAPESGTLCTGVRFGNVLGSRGSVVPTFERQIERGGPVTITHPDMTRYFMSIPEAVSLVIQAATATEGGDLFVLDMGEQIGIEELALRLIRLRGLRPGVDVQIRYTGVRPGEKLHEELTADGDEAQPTSHPSIMRLNGGLRVDRAALCAEIRELVCLAEEQRNGQIAAKLQEILRLGGARGLGAPGESPGV